MSVADWASVITAKWQSQVSTIIETGTLLLEARKELKRGEWGKMVAEELPFGLSTAEKLMCIAKHPVLTKSELIPNLPPSWGCLYELAKFPEEAIELLISEGRINCETRASDAKELLKEITMEGVYLYASVPEALCSLLPFTERWPDAKSFAHHIFDQIEEGDLAVGQDGFKQIIEWLAELHTACEKLAAERESWLS